MKMKYSEEVDILYISFNDDKVVESDESKPGIIIDYNADGNPVGIEIHAASSRVNHPDQVIMERAA